jgi:hypothetical protein
MEADWSRLTHYPHHDEGPIATKRYAERQALLTRLNGMEGIFQRLQNGKNLGTKGAARTRIRDKGAHETIISIALMSMTAAALADVREGLGIHHDLTPANPAPRRPRKPNGGRPKRGSKSKPPAGRSRGAHGSSQRRLGATAFPTKPTTAGGDWRGTSSDGEAVFRF